MRVYIFNCRESCLALFSVEFAILVLVEQLGDNVVATADITVTIQIEGDVGDLGTTSGLLQLRVGLDHLTVGERGALGIGLLVAPPSGLLHCLVLKDVGAVVAKTHLVGCVEAELVNTGWLVHHAVKWRLLEAGRGSVLESALRLLVRY